MVRVSGRERGGVVYAVAESDAFLAVEIVRLKVGEQGEHVEDLGRVTDELIAALQLAAGEFKQV
jgi:hypothetical protein